MNKRSNSPRLFLPAAILAAFLLLCNAVDPRNAAAQSDGAALYQKHCAGCHYDGSKLRLEASLLDSLRTPPPGMPLFGENKLSDRDARTIGEYLRPGSQLPAEQKADPERKAAATGGRSFKEKKSWMEGFGTSDR